MALLPSGCVDPVLMEASTNLPPEAIDGTEPAVIPDLQMHDPQMEEPTAPRPVRLWRAIQAAVHVMLMPGLICRLSLMPSGPRPWSNFKRWLMLVSRTERPFGCANWPSRMRLQRIIDHHAVVSRIGGIFRPTFKGARLLCVLGAVGADYMLTVDEPAFLLPDGLTAVTLWWNGHPMFWLSMSFGRAEGKEVAFVTGLQGRAGPEVTRYFKTMTKQAHGMRPRDLTIHLVQVICHRLGVERILAVADDSRQHFTVRNGWKPARPTGFRYDEAWLDRGGVAVDADWFELPLVPQFRDPEDIPARKRALYRQRYAMLEQAGVEIDEAIRQHVTEAGPDYDASRFAVDKLVKPGVLD